MHRTLFFISMEWQFLLFFFYQGIVGQMYCLGSLLSNQTRTVQKNLTIFETFLRYFRRVPSLEINY